ncbi:hypothetical protein PUN28_001485 [Cardiocondyla obscurior]|uniref:Uncharacterized protein n=1 Tax=Cardiocondyla obscurior TaxID=286306 RepID=A0AAW2H5B3_9HYME
MCDCISLAIDLLLDVRFTSDYPTPVPRARNQYQSRGEHRHEVPSLNLCRPVPHRGIPTLVNADSPNDTVIRSQISDVE